MLHQIAHEGVNTVVEDHQMGGLLARAARFVSNAGLKAQLEGSRAVQAARRRPKHVKKMLGNPASSGAIAAIAKRQYLATQHVAVREYMKLHRAGACVIAC
jgi:hypothetical protein